ncbi:MAG: c-type cytochrome [Deltaproteobacteria bacterium]|nr:c-type cytochrome [Deltaproteobacteria bacterium]
MQNPIPSSPVSLSRAQKNYVDKCAYCHGVRGDGNGEMAKALDPHPSNFTDRHMMKEMTDGEIFWKITTGKGAMPSYQNELTEKERWDLVNFLKFFAEYK